MKLELKPSLFFYVFRLQENKMKTYDAISKIRI